MNTLERLCCRGIFRTEVNDWNGLLGRVEPCALAEVCNSLLLDWRHYKEGFIGNKKGISIRDPW